MRTRSFSKWPALVSAALLACFAPTVYAGQEADAAKKPATTPNANQATSAQSTATQTKAAKAKVQGMFWKATSGANTVYLLGSIHVASDKMYPLPKAMEATFKESKTLVVEIDINKVDQSQLMTAMQEKGFYQGDDNLFKHISAADQKKLTAMCEKYNMPVFGVQRMRPWVAALTLSLMPYLAAGMSADKGIDQHFLDEAAKSGKTVDQAETMEFQLNLLSSTPEKQALANLHQELNATAGKADSGAAKLQDAWIAGDVANLEKFMAESREKDGSDRKLIEDRNPHMADVAEKYLKGKTPCFFVVGAAHLIGPEGVISILKKRGYQITQILNP